MFNRTSLYFLLLVHTFHTFFLQAFLFLLEGFQFGHQAALSAFTASLLLLDLCLVGFEDSAFAFECVDNCEGIVTVNSFCMHLFGVNTCTNSCKYVVSHCFTNSLATHTVEVVEEVEDPANQILLDKAVKYNKKVQLGEIVDIPLETKEFGRIAAQNARGIVVQKIREVERGMTVSEFTEKRISTEFDETKLIHEQLTHFLTWHDYTHKWGGSKTLLHKADALGKISYILG